MSYTSLSSLTSKEDEKDENVAQPVQKRSTKMKNSGEVIQSRGGKILSCMIDK